MSTSTNPDLLRVTMLGSFSIRHGEAQIDDSKNRMKKVWLLLAYLIYTRGRTLCTQESYLSLFRGSDESEDPAGRLKSLFYRSRTLLDQAEKGLGRNMIRHVGGVYAWNTDVPLWLDVEEFDRLCTEAATTEEPEDQLARYQAALALYQGDFLPKLSTDPWVMPISTYYHQMFLEAAERTLTMLEERERWLDAANLSAQALRVEAYSERLYQHQMRCRIALGDRLGAVSTYEEMSKVLFHAFGLLPSDDSRALYREATRELKLYAVPINIVQNDLMEPAGPHHAMVCEYDFFKLMYRLELRSLPRTHEIHHIILFSLTGSWDREIARRSMDVAAEHLIYTSAWNLRQGDVISRFSESQVVVMLLRAGYEDSCKVAERIVKAYFRKYPHSPVKIRYAVQRLEPPEERDDMEDGCMAAGAQVEYFDPRSERT